jgi:hypothetical protein
VPEGKLVQFCVNIESVEGVGGVGTETILKIFSASNDESSTDRSAANEEQMDGIH